MGKMEELAVMESAINCGCVTLKVKNEELQDLCRLFDEWQDLRNQVDESESDMDMDVQGLLRVLLKTGADHLRLDIVNFTDILEGRP